MDSITSPSQPEFSATADVSSQDLLAAASEAIEVESIRHLRSQPLFLTTLYLTPTLELRGRLRMAPERAYEIVAERFRALGHVAVFRRIAGANVVLAAPGSLPVARGQPWLAIAFFIVTLLSVFFAGGGGNILDPGSSFKYFDPAAGSAFAAGLLSILLAHEFGHYLVARRLGLITSLPYFVPLPIPPFGTLGALIRMKAPPRNKRHLFAVAIAGPLAGLAVAMPILVYGLMLSPVAPVPPGLHYTQEGNSLLYIAMKFVLFGQFLPSGGADVILHPLALAGWAGLLVTGLNLIPAGQLDGGHIVYALFGARSRWSTFGTILVMFGLSVLWQGWLLWAALIYLLGRAQAAPLDEITPLRPAERALGVVMILLFAIIFSPIPLEIR